MADNTTLDPGTGGDTVRDKDRAGVKTAIVGLDLNIGGASETLMTGAMPVTDNGGSLTVDDGGTTLSIDDGAGSITVDGTVGISGAVNLAPVSSGGLSVSHTVSAASTNATVVKASAGQLYGWYVYNSNAAARKVAFHDSASTPTAGASILFSIVIPAASGANVEFTQGIAFSSGIAFTTVTGLADSDATAVGANDLVLNLFYK